MKLSNGTVTAETAIKIASEYSKSFTPGMRVGTFMTRVSTGTAPPGKVGPVPVEYRKKRGATHGGFSRVSTWRPLDVVEWFEGGHTPLVNRALKLLRFVETAEEANPGGAIQIETTTDGGRELSLWEPELPSVPGDDPAPAVCAGAFAGDDLEAAVLDGLLGLSVESARREAEE